MEKLYEKWKGCGIDMVLLFGHKICEEKMLHEKWNGNRLEMLILLWQKNFEKHTQTWKISEGVMLWLKMKMKILQNRYGNWYGSNALTWHKICEKVEEWIWWY